jgi:hypothetical protein
MKLRCEVLTAVKMALLIYCAVTPFAVVSSADVSEEHTVYKKVILLTKCRSINKKTTHCIVNRLCWTLSMISNRPVF